MKRNMISTVFCIMIISGCANRAGLVSFNKNAHIEIYARGFYDARSPVFFRLYFQG